MQNGSGGEHLDPNLFPQRQQGSQDPHTQPGQHRCIRIAQVDQHAWDVEIDGVELAWRRNEPAIAYKIEGFVHHAEEVFEDGASAKACWV